MSTPAFTIDAIVAKYIERRDEIKAITKRHEEELKPLQEKQEAIESYLHHMLNETGQESARTEHGTVYKSTVMSATVDPDGGWDKLIDYILLQGFDVVADCLEKNQPPEVAIAGFRMTPGIALLNRSVNKTAVKEMMDQQNGLTPPGVKVAHITSVNIKRA